MLSVSHPLYVITITMLSLTLHPVAMADPLEFNSREGVIDGDGQGEGAIEGEGEVEGEGQEEGREEKKGRKRDADGTMK